MATYRIRNVRRTRITVALILTFLAVFGGSGFVMGQSLFEEAVADRETGDERDSDTGAGADPLLEIRGRVRAAVFGSHDGSEVTETVSSGTVTVFVEPAERVSGMLSITADPDGARLEESRLSWRSGGSGRILLLGGYTILAFGRTDGIAPTEIINPVAPSRTAIDFDDQRRSRWLASGEVRRGGLRAQLVVLPDYVGREPPAGMAPGSLDLPDRTVALEDVGLAGRISWDGPGLSGSLVGYAGPNPEFGIVGTGGTNGANAPPFSTRVSSVYMGGVNLEVPIGAQVFRLDTAYRHPRGDHDDPAIPRPDLRSVAALERTLGPRATILVQYHNTWVAGWEEYAGAAPAVPTTALNAVLSGQTHQVQHALDGNLTVNNRYDTLRFSVAGQYSVTTEEYMARSWIEYNLGGGARVRGGYRYANGPEGTRSGLAGKALSGPFLEATLRF